jgi:dipeptidyl aminopeptidase/acylaminoacyl peptidase
VDYSKLIGANATRTDQFGYHPYHIHFVEIFNMTQTKTLSGLTALRHATGALATAGLFALGGLLSATAVTTEVHAQTAAAAPANNKPLTLEEFFRRSQFREFAPSSDGKYVATTAEVNGRFNLVIIDLAARTATAITNWNNIDVGQVAWAGPNRIIYQAIRVNAPSGQDSPREGGLFVVSRDGKDSKQLAKTASQLAKGGSTGIASLRYIVPVEGSPDEIFALGGVLNDDSFDVYRVNVVTGKDRLVTQGRPGDGIERWILDNKQVPRVAFARGKGASTEFSTFYRSSATSDWKLLRKFDSTKPPAFVPIAFDSDDKTMFIAANDGRDNMAVYRFDPEANKILDLVAQHPQYDMGASPDGEVVGRLLFDPNTDKLRGIRLDADKPTVVWLDEKIAQVQAAIDRTFPNMTNSVSATLAGDKYFVSSFSDTMPGRYYVYDPEKRNMELLGSAAPWLENRLANVIPFKLKTRDGLEIPSYYVLPKDYKPGTKLPTIVHIHGGPMARDIEQGGRYGYSFGSREAQILAARGYAVVLPNFRVTPQLGSKIYYAGFGSYGKEMLDDHEDAVKWAIDQGFADPKKMCISGASYGGYAALQALTRPTNPFTCSISGLPVTDLNYQHSNADYSNQPSSVEYWRKVQGVPNFRDPWVRASSPLFNVEKIKVPVFMYIGEDDARVPPTQAARMRDALAAAGNPLKEYYIGKGEGHGYGVTATNIELYEKMFKFLDAVFK